MCTFNSGITAWLTWELVFSFTGLRGILNENNVHGMNKGMQNKNRGLMHV